MEKYGVVDIGSNTVRLEVYNVNEQYMQLFFKKKEFLGLANYVEKGKLSEEGVQKTIEVLKDYISICELLSTKELFIFATAAIRNASNSHEVIQEIEEAIDYKIDLISGEREAELGFMVVTNRFGIDTAVNIDIGGGSTELSVYENGEFVVSKSFNDGSLSLYREHVSGILPTEDELETMSNKIKAYIKSANISDKSRKKVCGVGGTLRLVNRLVKYYYLEENDDIINVKRMTKLYKKLIKGDKELIKLVLRIAPERIHSIIPGMLILNELCEHLSIKSILVSNSGVREGYLTSKIEGV